MTGTGVEKLQLPPATGALTAERPGRQQRPTRRPQAPGMRPRVIRLLVEPHPSDRPITGGPDCTPRFTALVSAASTAPGGDAFCQMLHGHWAGAPVVKLQDLEPLIGVPERFAPPTPSPYRWCPPPAGCPG